MCVYAPTRLRAPALLKRSAARVRMDRVVESTITAVEAVAEGAVSFLSIALSRAGSQRRISMSAVEQRVQEQTTTRRLVRPVDGSPFRCKRRSTMTQYASSFVTDFLIVNGTNVESTFRSLSSRLAALEDRSFEVGTSVRDRSVPSATETRTELMSSSGTTSSPHAGGSLSLDDPCDAGLLLSAPTYDPLHWLCRSPSARAVSGDRFEAVKALCNLLIFNVVNNKHHSTVRVYFALLIFSRSINSIHLHRSHHNFFIFWKKER